MLEPFLTALFLTFASEIADKTQLVILGLALKYKSPLHVFIGALSAHALMDMLAIIIGSYAGFVFPTEIKIFVGLAFVMLGIFMLVPKRAAINTRVSKIRISRFWPLKKKFETAFFASFLTVLLSEFGDKTQISSALLGAKYKVFAPVFLGTISALALAIGLTVFVGRKFATKLPRKLIKTISGILFVLFGIIAAAS